MPNGIQSTRQSQILGPRERMTLIQSTWSHAERRRRRELAAFLQKRLAWQLALETSKQEAVHA